MHPNIAGLHGLSSQDLLHSVARRVGRFHDARLRPGRAW
jgi:hypothetical protein